jgi:hypothetical protein
VGWNDKSLLFVAVDGRQPSHSMGMSLEERGKLMIDLGCREAVNMDGGGSTTMVVRGAVMNRPSDGIDRSVSNGWAVVSSAPVGAAASLHIWPETPSLLVGSQQVFQVTGQDRMAIR